MLVVAVLVWWNRSTHSLTESCYSVQMGVLLRNHTSRIGTKHERHVGITNGKCCVLPGCSKHTTGLSCAHAVGLGVWGDRCVCASRAAGRQGMTCAEQVPVSYEHLHACNVNGSLECDLASGLLACLLPLPCHGSGAMHSVQCIPEQ